MNETIKNSLIRRYISVALFNLISIVIIVIIAEFLYGTWLTDSFGSLNIPRETIRFDASNLYSGGSKIVYKRDHYGLRGKYRTPSSIDILTIGGSTTDQRSLTEGETWQDHLAALFHADGKNISVVNAGIDGQSTFGHLFNFKRWFPLIPRLRPKTVIVYVGINDVYVRMKDTADLLRAHSKLLRIHHSVKNNSAIYRLYRVIKGVFLARTARLTSLDVRPEFAAWTDIPNFPKKARLTEEVRAYKVRLRNLVGEIQRLDAMPLLVTQRRGDYKIAPNGKILGIEAPENQPNGIDEYLMLSQMNRATIDICIELGITCFDLASEIKLLPSDFYDRVHTNPSGARKIANYFYDKLGSIEEVSHK